MKAIGILLCSILAAIFFTVALNGQFFRDAFDAARSGGGFAAFREQIFNLSVMATKLIQAAGIALFTLFLFIGIKVAKGKRD